MFFLLRPVSKELPGWPCRCKLRYSNSGLTGIGQPPQVNHRRPGRFFVWRSDPIRWTAPGLLRHRLHLGHRTGGRHDRREERRPRGVRGVGDRLTYTLNWEILTWGQWTNVSAMSILDSGRHTFCTGQKPVAFWRICSSDWEKSRSFRWRIKRKNQTA